MTTSYRKPAPLELRLDAVPGSVPAARTALADYARAAGAPPDDVELAVAEATSNSILHGYTTRAPGKIDLRAEVGDDELLVTVADDGEGMRPNPQGGGLGLGLALIGQMTSSVTISRPAAGGTEIRMTFPIARRRHERNGRPRPALLDRAYDDAGRHACRGRRFRGRPRPGHGRRIRGSGERRPATRASSSI